MFVVKATLRDETRRLVFNSSKFPPYSDVQEKVSTLGAMATCAAKRGDYCRPYLDPS